MWWAVRRRNAITIDRDRRKVESLKNHRYAASFGSIGNRLVRRRQALIELGIAYVLAATGLAALVSLSQMFVLVALMIYLAFGSMIWTVLDQPADPGTGSGIKLLLQPGRWRRRGMNYRSTLSVYFYLSIFSVIWMMLVFGFVSASGIGHISIDQSVPGMGTPNFKPTWVGLLLLPVIFGPVALVYRRLVRGRGDDEALASPRRKRDRVLWNVCIFAGFAVYLASRGLLMHLPFPLGQFISSTYILLLTSIIAAGEITFLEAQRITNTLESKENDLSIAA
jgi:hypothetical protein